MSGRRTRALHGLLVLVLGAFPLLPARGQQPTATMGRIADALSVLLPAALEPGGWENTGREREILTAADALRDAADALRGHAARDPGPGFALLSDTLLQGARALGRELRADRPAAASFTTRRLVETCVACHVRLPARSAPDLAQRLAGRVDSDRLPPLGRAQLALATRQFERALEIYEAELAQPSNPLGFLELSDLLGSYLIVSVRVLRDPERAARGLQALARRPGLARELERNLGKWEAALRELGPSLEDPPSVERAQEILDAGRRLSEWPLDAAGSVHATVASSVLFRWLEQERPEGAARARALYLLAKTEAFTRRLSDLPETGAYLELAIRAAPQTEIAARAFARLELETIVGYAGFPPDEVLDWLAELRALCREALPGGDRSAQHHTGSPESELGAPAPRSARG